MRPSHFLLLAMAMAAALPAMAQKDAGDAELDALMPVPVYGSSRQAGASKYDQDVADAPTLVYVRTGGEIRAQGYRTLAEVLESMPGVHLRNDRTYQYTGVRGVNRAGDYSSRLLMLIDGVRVNDAIYDSATGGNEFPLDLGLIDRVEFIPGPGSALYGTNAALGVINIVTRGASQLPGWRAGVELGSSLQRKLSTTWGGDLGPARVLLGLSSMHRRGDVLYFPEFDNPDDNHGLSVGLDGERNNKLFAKARWSDFSLVAGLSDRFKSDPTASYGSWFNRRSDSVDRFGFADLSFDRALDDTRELFARVGLHGYDYIGYGSYGDDREHVVPGLSVSNARWISGELRHVWSGWAGHRLLTGIEFQRNQRQRLLSAYLDPALSVDSDVTYRSTRYSLFASDEWQILPRVRLNLGLRVDRRLDGQVRTTPRLAAQWSPTEQWTFKVQRGSAYREPNISESSYTDASQRIGSALRVESMRSNEVTALWRPRDGLDFSATAYTFDIDDIIELVLVEDGSVPEGTDQYENRGRVRARGVEFEGSWVSGAGLQLRGSWSIQRARDPQNGQALSDAPRSLGKLMLTLPGPWPGSRVGTNLLHVSRRNTVSGAPLPPVTRVNLQFTHAPPGQPWSLGVGVANVFDKRYADPTSAEFVQDSIAQDGRTWRVQLGWAF